MTDSMTLDVLRDRPLTDDRDLTRFVTAFLERARTTRAWLLLLDGAMRMTDATIPVEDLPEDPTATVAMPSSGAVSAADALSQRVAQVVDETPAASVVVVWERPDPPGSGPSVRPWAAAMRDAFSRNPAGLRAQFVLTDDGAHLIGEPMVRAA